MKPSPAALGAVGGRHGLAISCVATADHGYKRRSPDHGTRATSKAYVNLSQVCVIILSLALQRYILDVMRSDCSLSAVRGWDYIAPAAIHPRCRGRFARKKWGSGSVFAYEIA
jgi:hypothetical protein